MVPLSSLMSMCGQSRKLSGSPQRCLKFVYEKGQKVLTWLIYLCRILIRSSYAPNDFVAYPHFPALGDLRLLGSGRMSLSIFEECVQHGL